MINILDLGAVGDGKTNDGPIIQLAIDSCACQGGGKVVLPGGRVYCSGSIVLKSHVELYLESGAVLKASSCKEDYLGVSEAEVRDTCIKVPTYVNCEYDGKPERFFIYAKDAEHIAITGYGMIDGSEEQYYGKVTKWHIEGSYYPRIPLIFMEHVKHFSMINVTLTRSGFWTTHLVGCEDVLIEGIRILNNLRMTNCDGIDADHCKHVRIANCYIEAADDCIVLKNTSGAKAYGACEHICVTGCTLTSTSAAIKIGTESEGEFRNIMVDHCNITRTNRGISLQLRDFGCIENVSFSHLNIETRRFSKMWWGDAEPIAITAVRRKEGNPVGRIENIRFSEINCVGENGILIYGEEMENPNIKNIRFHQVSIELKRKTNWPMVNHDIRPCGGEGVIEGSLNAVYVRHAEKVIFEGLDVKIDPKIKGFVKQEIDIEKGDYTL